jgi:DNA-directed RNA polymerase specialized sigma24 family protein
MDEQELIEFYKSSTALSDREAEVLVKMGTATDKHSTETEARESVAEEMSIQPSTVDTYYRRGLVKLRECVQTLQVTAEELPTINEKA